MDAPKSLADPAACTARQSALSRSHVAPLASFAMRLRRETGFANRVPDFDPLDGGVQAECLFLLEAPGGRAVGSGFVSRNNPDETAKNFLLLNQEAGLRREHTVTWNVVPWYVGDGTKIRPVTSADIEASEPHLKELFSLLPKLRVVVLIGRKAQRARALVKRMPVPYEVLECPHPSPLSLNGRPERRAEILHCLKAVAAHLASTSSMAADTSIEQASKQPRCSDTAHVNR